MALPVFMLVVPEAENMTGSALPQTVFWTLVCPLSSYGQYIVFSKQQNVFILSLI